MNDLSGKVKKALFTALSTVTAATAVYFEEAPKNAVYPFIVFQNQSNKTDYNFGLTRNAEDDIWTIKSVCDAATAKPKSAQALNDEIIQAAESAIGQELALSSGETWAVYRMGDLNLPNEGLGDRKVFKSAFMLRTVASDG